MNFHVFNTFWIAFHRCTAPRLFPKLSIRRCVSNVSILADMCESIQIIQEMFSSQSTLYKEGSSWGSSSHCTPAAYDTYLTVTGKKRAKWANQTYQSRWRHRLHWIYDQFSPAFWNKMFCRPGKMLEVLGCLPSCTTRIAPSGWRSPRNTLQEPEWKQRRAHQLAPLQCLVSATRITNWSELENLVLAEGCMSVNLDRNVYNMFNLKTWKHLDFIPSPFLQKSKYMI